MSVELDFLSATDRPALLGLTSPDLIENTKAALEQLGFKAHQAENHGEFLHKFSQVPYQLVVLEDLFASRAPEENESLISLQRMPVNSRRQAVIVLFGASMATLNPLQAFQYGVHAVVNPNEMFLLTQIIQKVVTENDIFLHTFREAQKRHG